MEPCPDPSKDPESCPECDMPVLSRGYRDHLKTVHQRPDPAKYRCPESWCSHKTIQQTQMRDHLHVHPDHVMRRFEELIGPHDVTENTTVEDIKVGCLLEGPDAKDPSSAWLNDSLIDKFGENLAKNNNKILFFGCGFTGMILSAKLNDKRDSGPLGPFRTREESLFERRKLLRGKIKPDYKIARLN